MERKGDSAFNDIHNLDLVQQFKGSENRLHKQGYYSFPINCKQDFSYYPFDRQVCDLHIFIDLAGDFVNLTPENEKVGHWNLRNVWPNIAEIRIKQLSGGAICPRINI